MLPGMGSVLNWIGVLNNKTLSLVYIVLVKFPEYLMFSQHCLFFDALIGQSHPKNKHLDGYMAKNDTNGNTNKNFTTFTANSSCLSQRLSAIFQKDID